MIDQRPRGIEVPSTSKQDLETWTGRFIPHIYARPHPVTGEMHWGLGPNEFHLVTQGFACARCLADYGGMYRMTCPVCGHERDVLADVEAEPDHWKPDPNDPYRA